MENVASQLAGASKVILSIIPIVGIVMGCTVVFFYILWNHRERMLMINKGTYAPRPVDIDTFALLAGILLVAVGLTLTLFFLVAASTGYTLLGGLIPLSVGVGFLVFYTLRAINRAK